MRTPERILAESLTIAVVGASRDPSKVAHSVPAQLQRHGWRIIPVNPYADMLFDQPAHPLLSEIPEPVDIVNVFRPSDQAADVARQAVAIGAKALWLQTGIVSAQARQIAVDAGMDYVEDNCIAVARAAHALRRTDRS